jgi:Domain of unknown function (DUF4347)/FG-GAP-like repeat
MTSSSLLATPDSLMMGVIPTSTLVVFDSRVQDINTLSQALLPGSIGFTIGIQDDGLERITELLAATGAKYLSVVAHGEPGVVHLGKTPLDIRQLQSQSHQLQQWGVNEIALYSCEVAQGDVGKDLIHQLSELTGATVAAAATKIGSATLGGNWNLTVTTGEIVPLIPFAAEIVQTYQAVLVNFPTVYSTGINYTPGATSEGTSLGDFNNDGNLDLVTRTDSGDNVLVALGDGNGGFSTTQNFPSGFAPKAVNVGDFNGDGRLDLVIGHWSGVGVDNISILLGNGDGTFASATNINNIGTFGGTVQVGDFNSDGKPDIAVANILDRTVSVLLNNGNGTFGSINKINLTTSLSLLRLGDFNGDGKLDVITAGSNTNNPVSVSLGNRDGTFQPAINTLTGPGGYALDMSVGDLNGDGKLDLATINAGSNNVAILLGNGDGTFVAPTSFVVGGSSKSIAIGDFNGDGKLDLTTSGLTSVFVLQGNGNGTFGTATELRLGSLFPRAVKVGDFNKDGKPDLVTANEYGTTIYRGSISVLLNATSTRNDFNGDGKSDILWRNTNGNVALWQMNGSNLTNGSVFANVSTAWTIASTGDFDGDSKSDILWRNTTDGSVAIWQMNGATPTSQTVIGAVPTNWQISGTGDFNGDSKADILWRNTTDGSVAIWQMNGNTATAQTVVGAATTDWKITGTGDFNGDGKADILWRNDNGDVAMWEMNGTTPLSQTVVGAATTDWKIAGTGDFNGDGKADILWRNDNGQVAIWQMNGTTVLSKDLATPYPSVDSSWKIAGTSDFNGDGKADILWRNTDGSVETWLMNGSTVTAANLVSPNSIVDSSWNIAAPIL